MAIAANVTNMAKLDEWLTHSSYGSVISNLFFASNVLVCIYSESMGDYYLYSV